MGELLSDPIRLAAFIALIVVTYLLVSVAAPAYLFSNSDIDPSTPIRLSKTTKLNVVGTIFCYICLFIIFLPYMAVYGIYRAFTWHSKKEEK